MKDHNELYEIFKNTLTNKSFVCFGIGATFWKFINVYGNRPISMLIDNQKYGEKLKIEDKEYTIFRVDEIKNFDPNDVVILITSKYYDEMKDQIYSLGYFNVFSWSEIENFNKSFYSDANKYLLTFSSKQKQKILKLKIAHITYASAGNAGDIVLSHCVRQIFNKVLGDSLFEIYSVDDSVDLNLINKYNQFDAILIGGGGLFLPDTNKNKISGWQWACSKELMAKIRKPLIGFAIGYNYFNGQHPDEIFKDNLKYFAQKSCFLGLRNQRSLRIIGGMIGFVDPIGGGWLHDSIDQNMTYQPCPTTFMEKYLSLPEKIKTKNVAVNIGMDRLNFRFADSLKFILSEVVKSIKEIHNLGYEIFITVHCKVDWLFVKYLYEQNFNEFKVIEMFDMSPLDIIAFYRNMNIVIGSRGHASMIPFGVGTKIISLGTHPKLKSFLEDVDALDWYIDLNNDKHIAKNILKLFNDIIENEDEVLKKIYVSQNYLYHITINNLKRIKATLNI